MFLKSRAFQFSTYELALCYMVFGGIPYYLNLLDTSLSLAQNIDALLFSPNGELHYEFDNLYAALFQNSQDYIKVVQALGKRRDGMTRNELQAITGMKSGGSFSKILENLEHCGFIRQYSTFGNGRSGLLYQLVDFFTLFYLSFLKDSPQNSTGYWLSLQGTQRFHSWAGLTYELLVLQHIEQVKNSLGIQGVLSQEYAYRIQDKERGNAQIDLLIDRKDNTISVCEVKFSTSSYIFTQEEELRLRNRLQALRSVCPAHKTLQLVLITTFGIAGGNGRGIVNNSLSIQDFLY